jgi:hypothetical protein
MTPPAFDHDLSFSERVEDFAVEQFVAQAMIGSPPLMKTIGILAVAALAVFAGAVLPVATITAT